MKNKSILSLLTFALSALMLTTSCEDMLTPDLDRYATEDQYGKDSIYSALGVLRSIQNVAERTVLLGECRGDLVTSGTYTTDSIGNLINFGELTNGSSALLNVADYYHIVNSCNFYLANVDTTVTENTVKIMQREWAQVQAMRGWAYVQLVRLYGEVPFVTVPVTSTDQAETLQKSAEKVNASNLIDKLNEAGLSRALELQHALGMPDYGTFTGGGGSYDAQANLFPVQIVMGDAYLMNNDYANAANAYYDYFKNTAGNSPSVLSAMQSASNSTITRDGVESKLVSSGNLYHAINESGINEGQVISSATGASTSADGRVFDVLLAATGFRVEKGTFSADERYQQLIPSKQFLSLARAQRYNYFEDDNGVFKREEYQGGDGRRLAWAPDVSFRNGNKQNMITKYAYYSGFVTDDQDMRFGMFSRNYQIPFYRTTPVLLRFAEAINRLGFPELAFGILKDGLVTENLPAIRTADIAKWVTKTVTHNDTIMDVEADTIISIETVTDTIEAVVAGKLVSDGLSATVSYASDSTSVFYATETDTIFVGDSIWVFAPSEEHPITMYNIPVSVQASWYGIDYMLDPTALNGGMYYLSMDERKAMQDYPFLDFESDANIWSQSGATSGYMSFGVHGRGCGQTGGIMDTTYTYARQVAEKVAEDRARKEGLSYAAQQELAQSLFSGDTLLVTDKEVIINAVENLIADEAALESCFEGHRFTDLIRYAEHKNNAGLDGTEWLAWKVARRDQNYTDDASQVDAALRAKLISKDNWYLPMP